MNIPKTKHTGLLIDKPPMMNTSTPSDCRMRNAVLSAPTFMRILLLIVALGFTRFSVAQGIVVIPPPDVTVECDQPTDPGSTGTATSQGGCGAQVITFSDNVQGGNCPEELTIFRNWMVVDTCGNSDNATQTITVVDTQAPTWDCQQEEN